MARFLVCVWPARGHVYPALPIARALRAQGHTVAVVTRAEFRHLLTPLDITYYPLVADDTVATGGRAAATGLHMGEPGPTVAAFRRMFIDPAPVTARAVSRAVQAFQPDVLVHDQRSYGPALIAERDGIPLATLCLTCCSLPHPDLAPFGLGLPPAQEAATRARYTALRAAAERAFLPIKRTWDGIRGDFGLPPYEGALTTSIFASQLVIIPAVPELDYGRTDLPAHVHYVGPIAWDPPSAVEPGTAAWLDALPAGVPLVLAGASTATFGGHPDRRSAAMVQAAIEGVYGSGVAVLGTLPFDHPLHDQAAAAPWGPLAHLARFVPHTQILPRASAVVTHAGFGMAVKALAHGLPLVTAPFAGDQPEVAQRVVAAGAGIRLDALQLTPKLLREAVETVLQAPQYRDAAQRIAAVLAQHDGPREAVLLLEQLAAHGRVPDNRLSYSVVTQ